MPGWRTTVYAKITDRFGVESGPSILALERPLPVISLTVTLKRLVPHQLISVAVGRDTVDAGPRPAGTNCLGEDPSDSKACKAWSALIKYDASTWGRRYQGVRDHDSSLLAARLVYSFSKRTAIYAQFAASITDALATISVSGSAPGSNPALGRSPRAVNVGLRHSF